MRRFLGLVVLVLFAMPLGLSIAGCGHGTTTQYCNGSGFGPTYGQVSKIVLASNLTVTGESLNYGQIGPALQAQATDCVGSSVSVSRYIYATTDMTVADINPSTGAVCGGSWNRNTGGGIADYTVCTPPPASNLKHVAYITASANGAVSNPIAAYIHAPVTGVVLGNPSTDCTNDPASNCAACNPNTVGNPVTAPPYDPKACLSQGSSGQLVARVYSNGATDPADNITCQVGPVAFSLQGVTNIATLNAQGVATANQPGSALVTATVSNSSSALNSGFFSTCPPASITLAAVNQPAGSTNINVALNTSQTFTATVLDTNNVVLNGIALEFNSTLPINFPTSSGSVTPVFPGSATVTAVCQPPSCNTAPFSQIGYLGNGKPVTSNGITVTASGRASDVLYMASTSSQYVANLDFTTGQLGSPIKLPYVPNSMVISQDGSTLYFGSQQGLMTVNTASNTLGGTYSTVQGTVLTVAPNNSYAVVTDPSRNTVSLVASNGAVASSFNGTGLHAQWSPDSNTLYVATTGNQLLTYSTFVGWESTTIQDEVQYNDVAVTVPSVGAYFAGPQLTEGRSYCPSTTLGAGTPPAATNTFSPLADSKQVQTDRLSATTDGNHILGAAVASSGPQFVDLLVTLPKQACPVGAVAPSYFTSSVNTQPVANITASAINGVIPASTSAEAMLTYTGSGGYLPMYIPATSGPGALNYIALSGGASTAPIAGVFSTDNTTFYVGTSGDNQVHIISISGATGTDTGIINPSILDANGKAAPPNLIASRPRRTTS